MGAVSSHLLLFVLAFGAFRIPSASSNESIEPLVQPSARQVPLRGLPIAIFVGSKDTVGHGHGRARYRTVAKGKKEKENKISRHQLSTTQEPPG